MSRRIEDLHPEVQLRAQRFLLECEKAGLDVLITCTWRSHAEQAQLYAIGRTKPGKKVTNAQPGQSSHNYTIAGKPASLAFDVVPLRNGKPVWGTLGEDGKLWAKVGAIGEAAGLSWAGRWVSFREMPHFELPNAKQIIAAGAA